MQSKYVPPFSKGHKNYLFGPTNVGWSHPSSVFMIKKAICIVNKLSSHLNAFRGVIRNLRVITPPIKIPKEIETKLEAPGITLNNG